jgi:hypothetical protein
MSEIMENNDIKLFDLLLHIPNYLSKRDRFKEDHETKRQYFINFAEDLRIFYNH